ncbi:MAG: ABC transporter ATP-binding protein [Bacilli bacterium]|nr:ABC transporter ATP-binding protein [Bacilli bacterium]
MGKEMPLLKLKNVSKFYYNKGLVATGFTRVNLDFNLGEFVVITGESGSGKSTLLNVLSGLDSYEEGELYINGEETSHYNESDFEHYRKTYIGNIFQTFNLVSSYTVYQNIELVLLLNGFKKHEVHDKIIDLIEKVDLSKFKNTRVSKLSGGQKQRVAIARALAKDTPIIIADEPTGNLDSKSAKSIIKLLSEIAKDKLVVVVTHNYDQVEKYATRKIEMHDGKVREDISLKEYNKSNITLNEYKDIRFINKVLLGIRNTFNIVPKFVLMFLVFLFIIVAFLGEYSVFKNLAEEEAKSGYSAFFRDISATRIVIKKSNGSYFTNEDFNAITTLEEVQRIEKDDILLDTSYDLNNNEYYVWGKLENVNSIDSVDVGRLPENDNEVVVKGYEYDYYLINYEELFNQELNIYDDYGDIIATNQKLKVVGIIYHDDYDDDTIYVTDKVLNQARLLTNKRFAELTIGINGHYEKVDGYSSYMSLIPSKNVEKGTALIHTDLSHLCKNMNCYDNLVDIKIKNLYYEESLEVNIKNTFNKDNFKKLTEFDNYDDYYGTIFISYDDYNELYNKYTFQSSVFANEASDVDKLATKLEDLGFYTLKIKDSLYNYNEGIAQIINIFKIIVTIVLFIVLFFITYFVIKLIQKSKNVYYSTVRILGGSKKVIKKLISIELYTVYHLTFFLFMLLTILVNTNIISNGFIAAITSNLGIREFVVIYLILLLMSMLLSWTYSRKLFKSSAMRAYREEV